MNKNTLKSAALLILFYFPFVAGISQTNTVGLIQSDSTQYSTGYTLFAPMSSNTTYLIDIHGERVNSWTSNYRPGLGVMFLPDGCLLRNCAVLFGNHFAMGGGTAGRHEKYDWNNNLVWSYNYYSNQYSSHHDMEYLPNGNYLLIAWEKKTLSEAVDAGRDTANHVYYEVWSEKIIEVQPTGSSGGTIVWEWHVWDHLIQDFDPSKANYNISIRDPRLVNINFGPKVVDWLHINSVRFHPVRNEILLSVHGVSEIWVIDHSTTTLEAVGHSGGNRGMGGDILYRWGNPRAYGLGTPSDQQFYLQHDARWIEPGMPGEGNILVFDNGMNMPGIPYSSIDEIIPPVAADSSYSWIPNTAFGPSAPVWTYPGVADTSFYAKNISGATRLENGNTLICEGTKGKLFEITQGGQIVWEYVNPVNADSILMQGETPTNNNVFKVYRYGPGYSGLTGYNLTPSGPIELYPVGIDVTDPSPAPLVVQHYPNPFKEKINLKNSSGSEIYTLINATGQVVWSGKGIELQDFTYLPAGPYFLRINTGNTFQTKKLIKE